MNIQKITQTAAEAGKIILENGGETYRVEEIIIRICNSFGVQNADSFVTPTGIMITATNEDNQTVSVIRRIRQRTTDLEKIVFVSQLVHTLREKKLSLDYFEEKLSDVHKIKKYSNKINIFCSCLSAACFTAVFGGKINDFLVAFLVGGIVKIVAILFGKLQFNDFFINLIGGGIIALGGLLSVHCGITLQADKIIVGTVMLLVPGIAITNAIRDSMTGDLLSGLSRGLEAFLIAISIAVGVGIVLKLWFYYFGIHTI